MDAKANGKTSRVALVAQREHATVPATIWSTVGYDTTMPKSPQAVAVQIQSVAPAAPLEFMPGVPTSTTAPRCYTLGLIMLSDTTSYRPPRIFYVLNRCNHTYRLIVEDGSVVSPEGM
jgi:hypothetical protein